MLLLTTGDAKAVQVSCARMCGACADYGVESSVALEGKSAADVESALKKLMAAQPVQK